MTVMLELEPDLEARVAAQAKERRLSVPQFLHSLIADAVPAKTPEELGWRPGFFEETYGSLADDPIERPPQGEKETREAWQGRPKVACDRARAEDRPA